MNNCLSLSTEDSAMMRFKLESHLACLFAGNTILKYLTVATDHPETAIAKTCPDLTYPEVKLAYGIWLSMHTTDRHAVLSKFQTLCAGLSADMIIDRKTIIFCSVFINEFAAILAETSEWPD